MPLDRLKPFHSAAALLALIVCLNVFAERANAGSLYLPTQLSAEIEARIERLFVIANIPVIKRPIPLTQVHRALERAAQKDPALVASVKRYLQRYSKRANLSHFAVELSDSDGSNYSIANERGFGTHSRYLVSAAAYAVISDTIALNVGGIAGERETDKEQFPEGSFLSLGWDYFQTDIGFRPRWWGPFQESSMLMSTNAAAMPSVTFSNAQPLPLFNTSYEIFWAEMSESDGVKSAQNPDQRLSGKPKLLGVHLGFQPFNGFAIGFNRLMQYGGADRDESPRSIAEAFFQVKDNENVGLSGKDLGNQLSSITTRLTFDGEFPLSVYMEYAGEDTSLSSDFHLGNTSLMLGLHLPKLTSFIDLSLETAEWQNAWYVNSNYADGLRQHGSVVGHWAGNQREFSDAVGAKAHTVKTLIDIRSGSTLSVKYQQVTNNTLYPTQNDYQTGRYLNVEFAQSMGHLITGLSLTQGNDVWGEDFAQLTGFVRW